MEAEGHATAKTAASVHAARALITHLDAARLKRLKAEWLACGGRVSRTDFLYLLSRTGSLGGDAAGFSEEEVLRGMLECWNDLDTAGDGLVGWAAFSSFLAHTSVSFTQAQQSAINLALYTPAYPPTTDVGSRAGADLPESRARKLGEGNVQISVLKLVHLEPPVDRYLLCERHGHAVHLRLYAPTPRGLAFTRALDSPPFVLTDAAYIAAHKLLAGSFVGQWVQLWDGARQYAPHKRIGMSGRHPTIALAWCGRADVLAGGTAGGTIVLWRAATGWAQAKEASVGADAAAEKRGGGAGGAPVTCLVPVVVAELELLVSGSLSGELHVWHAHGGHKRALRGHSGGITALVHARSRNLLISAGLDRMVCAWNIFMPSGAPVARLDGFGASVVGIGLPDASAGEAHGAVFVTGDVEGSFRVVSLRSLRVVQEFRLDGAEDAPARAGQVAGLAPHAVTRAVVVRVSERERKEGRRERAPSAFDDPRDRDGALVAGFALERGSTDRIIVAPAKGTEMWMFAPTGLRRARPRSGGGGAAADDDGGGGAAASNSAAASMPASAAADSGGGAHSAESARAYVAAAASSSAAAAMLAVGSATAAAAGGAAARPAQQPLSAPPPILTVDSGSGGPGARTPSSAVESNPASADESDSPSDAQDASFRSRASCTNSVSAAHAVVPLGGGGSCGGGGGLSAAASRELLREMVEDSEEGGEEAEGGEEGGGAAAGRALRAAMAPELPPTPPGATPPPGAEGGAAAAEAGAGAEPQAGVSHCG